MADTGGKIQGRRLDIYLPNEAKARKFGRRKVRVRVLELGDGTRAKTKEADAVVKQDVANEVAKNAEGSAATEDDIAAKNAREKKAAEKVAAEKAARKRQQLPAPRPTRNNGSRHCCGSASHGSEVSFTTILQTSNTPGLA